MVHKVQSVPSPLSPGPYANYQTRTHFEMPMQQEGPTIAGGEVTIRSMVRVSFQLE
jgi:hypothetical protein